MYYTYLWLREDGTPYYVGKGKGKRGYIKRSHTFSPPKDLVRIVTQDFETEEDAFFAEKFLICAYGREDLGTGCLLNLTEGGEGASGYKQSEETKIKRALSLKGKTLGRKHTEETRKKMSDSHTGVKLSEAHRKSTALGHIGLKRSKATKEKMRQSALTRNKNSERLKEIKSE